ncbi:MAG: DUF350 domain-containing protein [Corynebacterium sp.]|uniref:DUF350 domain-containing protein n=1 Tax=Corynebacterium sp. TaxID=1720 RepID=UPI0026DD3746|nr:DUF350 domain-containing protein [Corynebacterium sp.]MDO5097660.1 DUF350 domain-containing protein [Corynebacterium sp.]
MITVSTFAATPTLDSTSTYVLAIDVHAASFPSGVISTIAYFALALAIFILGFKVQDWLTPGHFRKQIFIDNLPNACVLAASQAIALGIVIATAIALSPDEIGPGLLFTLVYSLVGLLLQTVFLVLLELFTPNRLRDIFEDTKLRPSALVGGVFLIMVGAINAACLL